MLLYAPDKIQFYGICQYQNYLVITLKGSSNKWMLPGTILLRNIRLGNKISPGYDNAEN